VCACVRARGDRGACRMVEIRERERVGDREREWRGACRRGGGGGESRNRERGGSSSNRGSPVGRERRAGVKGGGHDVHTTTAKPTEENKRSGRAQPDSQKEVERNTKQKGERGDGEREREHGNNAKKQRGGEIGDVSAKIKG
jgi:hypothetical protein